MEQYRTIKRFTFGYAQYKVSDGYGDEVMLQVNYAGNTYRLRSVGTRRNRVFRRQVRQFATQLLGRKHGVNFAAEER